MNSQMTSKNISQNISRNISVEDLSLKRGARGSTKSPPVEPASSATSANLRNPSLQSVPQMRKSQTSIASTNQNVIMSQNFTIENPSQQNLLYPEKPVAKPQPQVYQTLPVEKKDPISSEKVHLQTDRPKEDQIPIKSETTSKNAAPEPKQEKK